MAAKNSKYCKFSSISVVHQFLWPSTFQKSFYVARMGYKKRPIKPINLGAQNQVTNLGNEAARRLPSGPPGARRFGRRMFVFLAPQFLGQIAMEI